jgi:diguanylate cyclase (GGDEF)-like protein
LCYVNHHDEAYQWAERRKLETHPKTGAAQLVEIRETVREIAIPKYVDVEQPAPSSSCLFAGIPDEQLLGYGVPEEWLDDVRKATEATVLELADHLPAETAEALLSHAAGDEALRHIAMAIRRTVREQDRVYRISGDEFGVLFTNFTEDEAAGAMRRVCSVLSKSRIRWIGLNSEVEEFVVSVSIGVAESSDPGQVLKTFELADRAAYESKKTGKGRVTRASDLTGDQPSVM